MNGPPIFILFGRPGAGKSTIANQVLQRVTSDKGFDGIAVKVLDLDICIPEWMKLNFQQGIYPTLEERRAFALDACQYVEKSFSSPENLSDQSDSDAIVISFSFVNNDLRDIFRERFSNAVWMLVDTNPVVAEYRIANRDPDHFYKGNPKADKNETTQMDQGPNERGSEKDKSEWIFDDVNFVHISLNGEENVESNVEKVLYQIKKNVGM